MDWRDYLITTSDQIRELLKTTTTIAVLGIKTEAQAGQPANLIGCRDEIVAPVHCQKFTPDAARMASTTAMIASPQINPEASGMR